MHEANNPFLAAALEYATCFGWHVFPVQPGRKEPATANGFLNATTDPDQIRAWWRSNPNANVGVVPGPSNLVILDLDKPVAKRLIEEYDIPDQFAWAATGKGDHLYLGRGQYEVKSHNWADIFGLDIRAETGYVVAPPSLHPEGGTYSWVHEPSNVLDTIPQRLRDLLTTLEKIQTWYRRYLNEGKVGNRNDIGSYVVQQLLDNRVPENVALILALHYQQTVRYQEGKGEYTEDEILATFRSTKLKPRRVAAFTSEDVGGFTPTDMGNARRFIARYGQQVRYNAVWAKWMYWTGYNWVIDEHQRARHMMQQIPKDIKAEMEKAQTDEIRDMLRKWLMRSEMHATQESSLLEAAKFPAVVAHPDDFDRDPWLLNTLSGVVDLHTGQTRAANPADMLHRVTNTVYDPTATCPTFERFLETIFKGNQRVIAFLQRFLGYCLTGLTTEQAWVLFIGPGSNGKSTLSEATAYSLGDYALTAPSSLFLERQGETIPNDIAKLPGRRLVYAKEPDKNKRLATGRIKELTGGDTISARFMRGEFFEFKPVAKLILSANHFPPVRDQSHGFWRRIFVLLFEVQIDEQDKELPEKLRAEAAGILNWLIAGCLEWQQQGLNPPQEVLGATKNYRTESDLLGEWINECCELDKGVETAFTPLYESWKAFLEEYGEIEDRSRRAFANRLVERGLQRRKTMNGPMYKGIRIQPNFKLTGHN